VANRSDKSRSTTPARLGATLIELLVVIVIFTILAASALPMIAPLLSNRQTREAARLTSTMFIGARNRAMQSGRPVGVVLSRMPGLPEACVSLAYADVPLPYAGDSQQSKALITYAGPIPFLQAFSPTYDSMGNLTGSGDVGWMGTVRVGDLIRFNGQGAWYQIGRPVNANAIDANGFFVMDPATPSVSPSPAWPLALLNGANAAMPNSGLLRFQIQRAPLRSSAGAVNLPPATVIDLNFSGFDLPNNQYTQSGTLLSPYGFTYSFQPIWPRPGHATGSVSPSDNPFGTTAPVINEDTSSIVITFSPSGALDTVWCWENSRWSTRGMAPVSSDPALYPVPIAYKPITPIHLLVGRREMVPLPGQPTPIAGAVNSSKLYDPNDPNFRPYANWQDLGNFWISIDNKSGTISTAQNSASDTALANGGYGYTGSNYTGYGSYTEIMESRRLAIELQRLGGR